MHQLHGRRHRQFAVAEQTPITAAGAFDVARSRKIAREFEQAGPVVGRYVEDRAPGGDRAGEVSGGSLMEGPLAQGADEAGVERRGPHRARRQAPMDFDRLVNSAQADPDEREVEKVLRIVRVQTLSARQQSHRRVSVGQVEINPTKRNQGRNEVFIRRNNDIVIYFRLLGAANGMKDASKVIQIPQVARVFLINASK